MAHNLIGLRAGSQISKSTNQPSLMDGGVLAAAKTNNAAIPLAHSPQNSIFGTQFHFWHSARPAHEIHEINTISTRRRYRKAKDDIFK